MASYFSSITAEQAALIRQSHLFFVATAAHTAEAIHSNGKLSIKLHKHFQNNQCPQNKSPSADKGLIQSLGWALSSPFLSRRKVIHLPSPPIQTKLPQKT